MPTINLTDALGLDLDGKLSDHTSLLKLLPSFVKIADLPLDQVPVADLSAALNLAEPIPVPVEDLGLTLHAGATARLSLLRPKQHTIDAYDPFSEIDIKDNEIYLMLGVKFTVNGALGAKVASLSLGFSPESELEIICYRRFERGPDGFPIFRKALATAASSFVLPRNLKDLDALQTDTVLVLRGSGTLSFSAGVSVALPTQSLASVSLVLDKKLQVSAGGSIGVDADLTLTGGYQVRLRRLDAHKTELGVYAMRSEEATLSISAKVGVSASAGPFELTERLISALSNKPAVDVAEFKQALPGEDDEQKTLRIEAFQSSIKAGISTKLQASLAVAFNALHSHEAAWLFEIDSSLAITQAANEAIAAALDGKFGALTANPKGLPAGISQSSNILTDTDLRKVSLKVNLLGLVNLISTEKLVQVCTAERNANGDITLITDSASGSRLQALLVIFGNDHKRLRKLLSENFLIVASYHAKDLGVLPPDFKAKHTYFSIEDKTSRDKMKNEFDVARILGLMDASAVQQRLGKTGQFGRTDFYVEAVYTSDAVRDAFLNPDGLRPSVESYEQIGRLALSELLDGDEGQEFRKKVANDNAIWSALKKDGNRANFPRIFGLRADSLDPGVGAAGADFSAITSWAEAMTAAGSAIRELDGLLGSGPVAADAANFDEARELLKKRLGQVVAHTKDEFGEPLGMLMFYMAASQHAKRTVLLSGDKIERLELTSTGERAVGATS